ncbi:MAG TPA: glycosyltransferase family 2 protein [Candidatus Baltobacteraceae bacterium]|nr:glycosyltransferase family 2 protein [Candidatus Baltobacteraceae bacterium]
MMLSIVATLFKSESTVDEFVRRSFASAEPLFTDIEMILVNDGSPDDSLQRALRLRAGDPRITVVDLSRNYGHHKAIMTGLAHAHGDLVFLLDSDLEEQPEYLAQFYQKLEETGADVVFGVQKSRKGGLFEKVSGHLFFWAANSICDQKMPPNTITARLMTHDYVRALVRHRHREFVLGHLFVMAGFVQQPVSVVKLSTSPSTYTLANRFDMAIRYMTTTSTRLLYLVLFTGLTIAGIAGAAIVYFLLQYLFAGIHVDGWTSTIMSVWFFGGLITLILGILGIYIANILSESKRGPYTTIRRLYRTNLGADFRKSVSRPKDGDEHVYGHR